MFIMSTAICHFTKTHTNKKGKLHNMQVSMYHNTNVTHYYVTFTTSCAPRMQGDSIIMDCLYRSQGRTTITIVSDNMRIMYVVYLFYLILS